MLFLLEEMSEEWSSDVSSAEGPPPPPLNRIYHSYKTFVSYLRHR